MLIFQSFAHTHRDYVYNVIISHIFFLSRRVYESSRIVESRWKVDTATNCLPCASLFESKTTFCLLLNT